MQIDISGEDLIPDQDREEVLLLIQKASALQCHPGLDPGSSKNNAGTLENNWTPDQVRGDEKSLSLSLVSDTEIQELNSKWRGKDQPTDVLSFSAQEGFEMPGTEELLGDIVISVDTAKSQAKQYGHSLTEELLVLFVHGLCHLLGYDHEKGPKEARLQAERETEILQKIGVNPEIALVGR